MENNAQKVVSQDFEEWIKSEEYNDDSLFINVKQSLVENESTEQPLKWTKKKKLQLILLLTVQLLSVAGYSLISPFYPQEAKKKHVGDTHIGAIFAVPSGVMLILSPVYGYFIIQLNPKFMCVAGTFMCGSACLLYGFLNRIDMPAFLYLSYIIRIFEGNATAMLTVASSSVLIKAFPEATSLMASMIEMAGGFGYVIGPAIGSGLYTLGGYSLPFFVVGGIIVAISLALIFVLPNVEETETKSKNFLRLLLIPGLTMIFIHCCVTCIAFSYLDPTLSDWMCTELNTTPAVVGLVFTGWSIVYALASPLVGVIANKGYIYSLLIIGLFGCGLSYLFLAPTPLLSMMIGKPIQPSITLSVVCMLLLGIFSSLTYVPPYQAALNFASLHGYTLDLDTIGMISGLLWSGYSLGSMIGPLLSGYLTEKYDFSWATTVMSFTIMTVGILLIVFLVLMKLTGRPTAPSTSDVQSITSRRQSL